MCQTLICDFRLEQEILFSSNGKRTIALLRCGGGCCGVSSHNPTALTRKFGTTIGLSDQEREAVEQLPAHSRHVKVGETLLYERDRSQHCMVVLSGLACRFKMVGPEGHRQIMSFHIHGDIPDLQSLHLGVMDHDVGMLQAGKVSFIPHTAIRAMNERHPRIAAALWRDTLVDAAIFRAWMIGIGRKSAYG